MTAAAGAPPARSSARIAYDWPKALLKSPYCDLSEKRPDGASSARSRASRSTSAEPYAAGSRPSTCAVSDSLASAPAYDSVVPSPT